MPESPITYTDLTTVNFGSFGTAVRDWKDVQSALKRLSTQAHDDMRAKSEAADWAGANADAVRPFVRKIAKEVGDLHAEARSIWNLIDDAHRELVRIQGQIEDEQEKAKRKQITIRDNGNGTVTCEFEAGTDGATTASGYYVGGSASTDPDKPSEPRSKADRELRDDIQSRINHLVGKAREIDSSTSRALGKSHGNDRHDSGHAKYTSLDDAQAAEAKGLAERQLSLYREGKELGTKDLARLAELTKYNAKDAEFSTSFYRDLGPKKALLLHAQMGIDASTDGGEHRMELARTVQNSMGTGLAEATRTPGQEAGTDGNRTHLGATWISALQRVGRSELPLGAEGNQRTLGYQVLGNVLRHGSYDKKFLSGVGNDMVEYERENGGPARAWPGPQLPDTGVDLSLDEGKGADRGFDPMTGLMKGLGNSPDAATEFFRGSTVANSEEVSNFDYFLGDEEGKNLREWPTGDSGKDDLGGALDAATTGRPAGDEGKPLKHTEEQAGLFRETVQRLGSAENASLVQHGGELAPLQSHMGNMAADYMHDIQRGVTNTPDGVIPKYGNDAGLGDLAKDNLNRFIRNSSQDPDGYASIMHASHAVSSESLRDALNDPPRGHDLSSAASMGARPGAEVAAQAAEGRADGIESAEDKVGAATRYNESLDAKQEIVGSIVDLGVGSVPYGGEAAGLVTGKIQEAIFDSYRKDPEEIAREVEEQRRDFLAEERRKEARAIEKIAQSAGGYAGLNGESLDWAASKAARDVEDGYRDK